MAQTLDTASDFITRIRERVNDPDATRYDNEEMLGYINTASRQITDTVARVWPSYQLQKSFIAHYEADIEEDQASYALPPRFYEPLRDGIYVDDDVQDIITLYEYKEGDTTGVIFLEHNIVISPTPDEDVTDGLEIYYVEKPEIVTSTSDVVPFGEEFPDMIIALVAMMCRGRNEDNPGFQAEVAAFTRQLMKAHISKVNQPTKAKIGLDVSRYWY